MKTKGIFVDNPSTISVLDSISNIEDESVAKFIESFDIDAANFAEFIKKYYKGSEEGNKILSEITELNNVSNLGPSSSDKKILEVRLQKLRKAGAHFAYQKSKWNRNMAQYIVESEGSNIIDLEKTIVKLNEASNALEQIAMSGRKILFVATKKQAKGIVAESVKKINMPYVTEHWPGGMLTNFATIRNKVRKMNSIDKLMTSSTWDNLSKRERMQMTRERDRLIKNFGGIKGLTSLPAAVFVVDISKEHIAVQEAKINNIPVFAIVNTNSDPKTVDFPIPANNDSSESVSILVDTVCEAIQEGIKKRRRSVSPFQEKERNNSDRDRTNKMSKRTFRKRKSRF